VRFNQADLRTALTERFVGLNPPMELPYLRELAVNMIENVLNSIESARIKRHRVSMLLSLEGHEQHMEDHSFNERDATIIEKETGMPSILIQEPDIVEKLTQLRVDIETFLSVDIIRTKISEFEKNVNAQGVDIEVRYRNPLTAVEQDTERILLNQRMQEDDDASTRRVGPSILDRGRGAI
jgi:hypothetical protein